MLALQGERQRVSALSGSGQPSPYLRRRPRRCHRRPPRRPCRWRRRLRGKRRRAGQGRVGWAAPREGGRRAVHPARVRAGQSTPGQPGQAPALTGAAIASVATCARWWPGDREAKWELGGWMKGVDEGRGRRSSGFPPLHSAATNRRHGRVQARSLQAQGQLSSPSPPVAPGPLAPPPARHERRGQPGIGEEDRGGQAAWAAVGTAAPLQCCINRPHLRRRPRRCRRRPPRRQHPRRRHLDGRAA